MKRHLLLAALVLLALGASGCVTLSDPEASQEYRIDVVAALEPGQSAGQTFIARRPRTRQITIWMRPAGEAQPGQVTFELLASPEAAAPLAVYRRSTESISPGEAVVFPFAPLTGPAGSAYYLRIRTEGRGINLLGRGEDAYPGGQAYLGEAPQEADLAFRLGYDWDAAAALSDLRRLSSRLGLLLPLALTLWAPGRLLLRLTRCDRDFDPGERAALSAGLSLSLIVVLLAWSSAAGIPWTGSGVALAASLLGGALLVALLRGFPSPRQFPHRLRLWAKRQLRRPRSPRSFPISLALLLVILAVLFLRAAMVRDLAGPAWVDSVHHGLITRLILEQGRLPESYAPYVDIETAGYHPGFHSALAVFTWLSGLDLIDSMLFFGQALNVLAVLAVYLFTSSLSGSRPAGLLAALLAGLFNPMPAYYTSWGRYTQLAGMVVLPAAAALTWRRILLPLASGAALDLRRAWPALALAGLTCGGLFLTHYRVLAFLGLLLLALLAVRLGSAWFHKRGGITPFLRSIPALSLVALLAVAFTLPWWPATLKTLFIPQLSIAGGEAELFSDFSWGLLASGYGRYLLGIAGLGLLWALFHRRGFALALALWMASLFLLANLDALWPGLPGVGLVNNTSVEIALYLPVSALCGYLLAWVLWGWASLLPSRLRPAYALAACLGVIALSGLGARSLLPILNPTTLLLRQADRSALVWAEANLPAESAAAINPFAWGYGIYAGQDGGFWLAPAAGIPTPPPPVRSGFARDPQKRAAAVDASRKIAELASQPEELYRFLLDRGIDTVFIGARGGALSPRALLESGLFVPVYSRDGAWIFRLDSK